MCWPLSFDDGLIFGFFEGLLFKYSTQISKRSSLKYSCVYLNKSI